MFGLALDTSTVRTVLSLVQDGIPRSWSLTDGNAPRHGMLIVPMLQDALRDAGLGLDDLDYLAVGLGPGSFTGLRVGLIAMKTLAYACQKPLIGFSSLELLAWSQADVLGEFSVLSDAQRGDFVVELYRRDTPGDLPSRIGLEKRISFPAWLEGATARFPIVIASASRSIRDLERLSSDQLILTSPDPTALAKLAHHQFVNSQPLEPWFVEPHYGRPSAAEEKAGIESK